MKTTWNKLLTLVRGLRARAAALGLCAAAVKDYVRRRWQWLCSLVAPPPRPFRVLSLGGGLDSFALLLLALQRGEHIDLVVFADVRDPAGEDPGEWPGTYQHLREVVMPLCQREGIPFVWLDSSLVPLRPSREYPEGHRSLFAYYQTKGMMFGRISRVCTMAAKVDRIKTYVRAQRPAGAPVEMWVGFEAGEESRAQRDPHAAGQDKSWVTRFPLIEAGLCRCACEALVRTAGYPVPRKSACVFCPFATRGDFQRLAQVQPETFAAVVALEEAARPTRRGIKLRFLGELPLAQAIEAPYRPRAQPCDVCGAPVRARKEVGCGFQS